MTIIDICDLKISAKELSPISDETLLSCLGEDATKDSILRILLLQTYEYDKNHEFNDLIDFYTKLIYKVESLLNIKYSEEERSALAIVKCDQIIGQISWDDKNSINFFISLLERFKDMKGDTDGMKYVACLIRYKLLGLYTSLSRDDDKYESMKDLLQIVKSEKEEYDRLSDLIHKKYYI